MEKEYKNLKKDTSKILEILDGKSTYYAGLVIECIQRKMNTAKSSAIMRSE